MSAFKALADETRLRLLRLLTRFELNVGEIVGVLNMGQSRISRHLRILVESGLLEARRDGLWVFYAARKTDFLASIAPHITGCGPDEDLVAARAALDARNSETRRFFNAIAPDWQAMRREVLGDLDLDALILERLPDCEIAVDLGCGPGELLSALSAKARGLIGVDASPAMLDLARRKVKLAGASLRVGELEHLPLADSEAQTAVLSLALHHLSDPLAALREARRVVAPGGTLVVVDYLKHANELMRERFGDRWLGFEAKEMSGWLDQAGFILDTVETTPVKLGLELGVYTARRPSIPQVEDSK
nr:metalloregulator ArsR/SmtB family transcription factor [Fundidesulfovibrio terrae]